MPLLDVGDSQQVFFETVGEGPPALLVHGGPGSGAGERSRDVLVAAGYRAVVLDQRMCGRSRPHASDPAVDLSGPADTAHELAQRWPDADLVIVDDAGHTGGPAFAEAIRRALVGE